MAELHVIGQLLGGSSFPESSLFCKWKVVMGGGWRLIEGDQEGQTQVDEPTDGGMAHWSHPIDLHFSTRGLQGWPKLHLQVWHQDSYGRNELYSYGFCHIPVSPGCHNVECVTWRPKGTLLEELKTQFIGGSAQLKNPDLVSSSAELYKLQTVSMGKVHLRLQVITRDFEKYGVEF